MKASNALLIAVFLLVVGAIAAGVYVSMTDTGAPPIPDGTEKIRPIPKVEDGDNVRRGPRDKGGTAKRTPRPRRESRIEGIVTNADGEPVLGATVHVHRPGQVVQPTETRRHDEVLRLHRLFLIDVEDLERPRRFEDFVKSAETAGASVATGAEVATATTDAAGNFDALIPNQYGRGPFTLVAELPGVGVSTAQGIQTNAPAVSLVLGAPLTASGQVLTKEDSIPVAGARVVLDDGSRRFASRTDEGGRFEIAGVAPGFYVVNVVAEGRSPLLGTRMHVAPGNPIELRLSAGTVLMVRVVTGDNEDVPLAKATVMLFEEQNYTYQVTESDADGNAYFRGVPEGRYMVNAQLEGYASMGDEQVLVRAGSQQDTDLWLEPTVDTPILMVDTDGRPVPGVEFYTGSWDDEYDDYVSEKMPGKSDTAGRYKFAFEFDGPHSAIFGFKRGYAMAYVYPDDHESGDEQRIIMRKAIRIHGRVTTPSGQPVPGASVAFEVTPDEGLDDDIMFRVRTDANGNYDFPYVPRGEIFVGAENEYDWADEEEIDPSDGKTDYEVNFTLELTDE